MTSSPWRRRGDPWAVAWLLGAAVVWGVHGFQDGLSRDSALYVYAGQEVAGGVPPYVRVFNRAGPLAHLLPGLGVSLGRATGLGDIVGIRLLFFLFVAVTPALTYLLAKRVFDSRLAGSAAAATLLAFPGLALSATDGPQSKQPMMLGLLVALLLLTHRRWLLAGVVTGLATLTWQPVVIALVTAALMIALVTAGDLRSRAGWLARFVAGGGLALALAVGYFLLSGALPAFIEGFWSVNAGYTDQAGLVERPGPSWDALTSWLGWTTWLFLAGCFFSIVLAQLALRSRPRGDAAALGATTLAAIVWSMSAFNGAPDALLAMPLAAVGVGGVVALVAARVSGVGHRWIVIAVAGWVLVALATSLHLTLSDRTTELAAERADVEALFTALPESATVFAAEAPQPLALTGRNSISRYVLFMAGVEEYVASTYDNGINGYLDWIKEQRPTLIVTSCRGLTDFLRPLASDYVEVSGGRGWRAYVDLTLATPGGQARRVPCRR